MQLPVNKHASKSVFKVNPGPPSPHRYPGLGPEGPGALRPQHLAASFFSARVGPAAWFGGQEASRRETVQAASILWPLRDYSKAVHHGKVSARLPPARSPAACLPPPASARRRPLPPPVAARRPSPVAARRPPPPARRRLPAAYRPPARLPARRQALAANHFDKKSTG